MNSLNGSCFCRNLRILLSNVIVANEIRKYLSAKFEKEKDIVVLNKIVCGKIWATASRWEEMFFLFSISFLFYITLVLFVMFMSGHFLLFFSRFCWRCFCFLLTLNVFSLLFASRSFSLFHNIITLWEA